MELTAKLHESDIQRIVNELSERLRDLLRPVAQTNSSLREGLKDTAIANAMPKHLQKDYLTTEDLKAMYNLTFYGIKPYRQAGLLTPVRFGKRMYYKRHEIDAILEGDVKLKRGEI